MVKAYGMLIGGKWETGADTIPVIDKYSGETFGTIPRARQADVARAVGAAQAAFASFAKMPAHRRAKILEKTSELLAKYQEDIAAIICREAGKAWKYSVAEVGRAVETFKFAAEEAKRIHGETIPMDASAGAETRFGFYFRTPVGVVAAISPFNFPLNLVAHKIAPALAAGCAVVLKPASQTPLSSLFLAELETEAGLPPGWLNVVCGPSSEIGDVLVEDERVKLITFTGSAPVGWALRERAPRKRVNLELGNATPVVVAADADLDDAAARLAANAFSFAGQSCISVQRIYVERRAYDAFLERFLPRVEALKVGDPADEDTDVGPLIAPSERERVLAWIEEAKSAGAAVLAGGTLEGDLIRPTVIANAPPEARVSCEEVFGPLCTVTPYDTFEEAIALANGTRFGLQAGVFTRDVKAALRAARELQFGGVTVNEAPTFRADQMPYGGVKDSGNTREGPAYAIREMTEERLVVLQL